MKALPVGLLIRQTSLDSDYFCIETALLPKSVEPFSSLAI